MCKTNDKEYGYILYNKSRILLLYGIKVYYSHDKANSVATGGSFPNCCKVIFQSKCLILHYMHDGKLTAYINCLYLLILRVFFDKFYNF